MNENEPNAGTEPQTPEAPATTPGTPAPPDEVTVLRSRNAGLDAKVTELTKAQKAAEAAAAEARQKLADYEAGKVGADEALRAQLQQAKTEAEQARNEAKLARIEAKFPEAFKELGELAVTFTDDKLASLETRLRGAASEPEPPTPLGSSPSRNSQRKPAPKPTIDDLKAQFATKFPSW